MRPLAIPTVLDGRFSAAFCPAPKGEQFGHVVDLSARLESPARELVHPFFQLKVDQLFRVGYIRRPIPHDLGEARAAHILYLREQCERPDYATDTDNDIL
jgi:hypothetical protein